MLPSRLLMLPTLCATSLALASDDVFVNPHVLERGGIPLSVVWNVRGSQPTIFGTANGPMSGAGECRMNLSLFDSSELLGLFAAASDGVLKSAKYDIASIGKPSELSPLYNIALEPMELTMPRCDVDSKEPRCAEATFRNLQMPVKAGISGTTARARIDAKKQKQWLPANFRLRCGDINTARVQTVESVHLGLLKEVTDTDIVIESSNIVFTLPTTDAGPFQKLFEEGLAGKETILPLRLEYLDEDGIAVFIIDAYVVVESVGPRNMFAPPSLDALAQVKAKCRWVQKVIAPGI